METYPLHSTLYYPVSGNPIGFNHFAAAEWMLQSEPGLKRVVFILSNGHHPDPTKPDPEVAAPHRLEILQQSIAEISDPVASFLARRAKAARQPMRSGLTTLGVSTLEFAFDRAVTTAETVRSLNSDYPGDRLNLFGGTDLIRRMANPDIFSTTDLEFLARACRYWIIQRGGDPVGDAVQQLRRSRGIGLDHHSFSVAEAPSWLAPFLKLSSTHIRHATAAGDPMAGMVTASAAALIDLHDLYTAGRSEYLPSDSDPHEMRSPLTITLERLNRALLESGALLAESLQARKKSGSPHTLSVVETSTGGTLTLALAARSGASNFFPQGRFAYDRTAKAELIGDDAAALPAVSERMVKALAAAMRDKAGTHFSLAESGMAGPPDGRRRSLKNGQTWVALASPNGIESSRIELNPFLTRREHQLIFAKTSLDWVRSSIA